MKKSHLSYIHSRKYLRKSDHILDSLKYKIYAGSEDLKYHNYFQKE
jgi:hypothetical protein